MRKILAIFTAVAGLAVSLTVAQPARACGIAPQQVDSRQNLQSDQIGELRAEAARLESQAQNMDSSASSLERQADLANTRARELRNLANNRVGDDREDTLLEAQQLAASAATLRAQAGERRAQAAQLRLSARTVRERAVRLANGGRPGGGGWRPVRSAQTI